MKAFFVTGTDTDAGKTTVTAALLRAFAAAHVSACAVKPVQTGCTEGPDGPLAPDVELWKRPEGGAGCCPPSGFPVRRILPRSWRAGESMSLRWPRRAGMRSIPGA